MNQIVLKLKSTNLLQVGPNDLSTILKWRNDYDFLTTCTRRKKVNLDEFKIEIENDFKKDRFIQFIISDNTNKLGTIYVYNFSLKYSCCFITTYIDSKYRNGTHSVNAFICLCLYMNKKYEVNNFYVDIYDSNKISTNIFLKCGVKIHSDFTIIKEQKLIKVRRFHFTSQELISNKIVRKIAEL